MARIEIGAKNVLDINGMAAQHMYILYIDDVGVQKVLRGGPTGSDLKGTLLGDIQVVDQLFSESLDYDKNGDHIRSAIWTGTNAQMQPLISAMRTEMNRINAAGYDYNLPFIETILPAWGDLNEQNSNTVIVSCH